MKIGILSLNAGLYSTRRLVLAAKNRGHVGEVIDYLRCSMKVDEGGASLFYEGKPLPHYDAALPRIGTTHSRYGIAVVRQWESRVSVMANRSYAIAQSKDKLQSLQMLGAEGVKMPTTAFAYSFRDVPQLIDAVGGAPLVVKFLEGTQGIGVVLAESQQAAQSVIEAFMGLHAQFLVQEYIEEAKGADIRAFVVGGRVIAAMERRAPKGDFRSNLHRGGSATKLQLGPEETKVALHAARALGLDIAGVDMVRSKRGPLVLEVNSSPGLEGIENTTGVDVAGEIVDWVARKCKDALRT